MEEEVKPTRLEYEYQQLLSWNRVLWEMVQSKCTLGFCWRKRFELEHEARLHVFDEHMHEFKIGEQLSENRKTTTGSARDEPSHVNEPRSGRGKR